MLTKEQILKCLEPIVLPNGIRLIESSLVSSVIIKENNIGFVIDCRPMDFPYALELKEKCHRLLKENLKIDQLSIILTSSDNFDQNAFPQSKNLVKLNPATVQKIIWVTSCKGGVGKSTITYLLAKALNNLGMKIGILDADIYGPSIPRLFGIEKTIEVDAKMIRPFNVGGIEFVSLGNVIDPDKAGLWRGPMVSKNLHQLLYKTNWSELDFLLIDMPPGTGDVALTIAEGCHVDGALVVTTPSDLALADNFRTLDMLNKLGVPLLAIIENMSFMQVGTQTLLPFGEGAGQKLAELADNKPLIKLPLQEDLISHPELLTEVAKLFPSLSL
jgi:ATP-binding protein involved in chromosome partitioning